MNGDLDGKHGFHKVHWYEAPCAGDIHVSIASRIGRAIRNLFSKSIAEEYGRVYPGQPIIASGTGYRDPYFPKNNKNGWCDDVQ